MALLSHFAPERRTVVETDDSDYALCCVLSQIIDKKLHPVAYYSRNFNLAGLNYEIRSKELLATVTAFKERRHYMEESKLPAIVLTDHKNLEYLMKESRQLNRSQAC